MKLMNAARRLARRVKRAVFDEEHDRFDLPLRFADEARLHLILHPAATAIEWEAYALSLARAAYQEGRRRGSMEQERREPFALVHPSVEAARASREQQVAAVRELLDGRHESDPLNGVPIEERATAAARLGELLGAWRGVPERHVRRR